MISVPLTFFDIEQNSPEWDEARLGLLTSSNMSKVMAKAGAKKTEPENVVSSAGAALGDGAKKLALELALYQMTGVPSAAGFKSEVMDRGHEYEPIILKAYEDLHFCNVEHGGFYCNETIGCSPDGRVGGNVVEAKSRISHVHYANIIRNAMEPVSKWQCISNVFLTGSEWIDFMSYCPDFPDEQKLFTYRLYQEDVSSEIQLMVDRIEVFMQYIEDIKENIQKG